MALNENPTLEEIINETERLNNLIVDRGGAKTITPKSTNQVLAKGNYKGDITIKGDANLVASNILQGKSIFGVQGSLELGKKWASGTVTKTGTVNNLTFKPRNIVYRITKSYYGQLSNVFGINIEEIGLKSYFQNPNGHSDGIINFDTSAITISSNGFSIDLKQFWGGGSPDLVQELKWFATE